VLKYLNGNGTLTKESSCVLLDKYIKYADDVAEELNKFHRSCERKFGVDTANLLRKRDGLNGLLYKIPAVFDSKHNYCTLQKSVAEKIERQKNEKINSCALPENFSFIIHSNKVFYCIDKKS
jgi:hypothetical protein